MDNLLISVIVPVYNTEKYLGRCVDSIINQTYTNLEIILVDDGSPDNSPAICDEYAKKDQRVKVIHKENGGLSSARNAGLDIAKGDFISFIDSDDWVEKDLFEVLVLLYGKTQAEIIAASFVGDCKGQNTSGNGADKFTEVTAEDYFIGVCQRNKNSSVCGRLFKKDLFTELRFPVDRLNEDFVFYADLLIKNKLRLVITEYQGYNYFAREGSITHQGFGTSMRDAVYNTQYAIELAEKFNPRLIPYCKAYNAYQSRTALIFMPNAFRKNNKDFEKLCVNNIKSNMKYCKGGLFNVKDFAFCRLYLVCPPLARIFTKRFKK